MKRWIGLAVLLASNSIFAADPPVQVEFGEPVEWTLEEAHYLLQDVRSASELSITAPTLDPNATNGSRVIQKVRDFQLDLSLNKPAGLANEALLDETRLRREINRGAVADINGLLEQQSSLLAQRETINAEVLKLLQSGAADDDPILKQWVAERGALDSQLTDVGSRITTLSGLMGSVSKPDFIDIGSAVERTTFEPLSDDVIKALADDTALPATDQLSNFVNMHYDLIAKQLTLLRDKAGDDHRILFVQLPLDFYSVDGKSNHYVVKTQWEVHSACSWRQIDPDEPTDALSLVSENRLSAITKQSAQRTCDRENASKQYNNQIKVVQLLPRRNALNVNETYGSRGSVGIGFSLANFLGLGSIFYGQQNELYERFVQQENYATSYGQGRDQFGWVFGPRPGTKRITPGPRSLHAVLQVPQDVSFVNLDASWCAFKRKTMAPERCADATPSRKVYTNKTRLRHGVYVPRVRTQFYVSGVFYSAVELGEQITVVVEGERFSDQMTILVNDKPLKLVNRIEVPEQGELENSFEIVNSKRMLLRFGVDDAFAGTPSIRLISPTRAGLMNIFNIQVNRERSTSLDDVAKYNPMFRDALTATGLNKATPCPAGIGRCFELVGGGFRKSKATDNIRISLGGQTVDGDLQHGGNSVRLNPSTAITSASINVVYQQTSTRGVKEVRGAFDNPYYPTVTGTNVLHVHERGAGQRDVDIVVDVKNYDPSTWQLSLEDAGATLTRRHHSSTKLVLKIADFKDKQTLVFQGNGAFAGEFFHTEVIDLPRPPTVTAVKVASTGASEGTLGGGYVVDIVGRELSGTHEVMIGDQAAAVIAVSDGLVKVKAPKAKAGKVFVLVKRRLSPEGKITSNAEQVGSDASTFTYVKPAAS